MKHPTPEQLGAFHDGTADARTLVAVETHLNECAECHEALASLDRQDRELAAVLTHDPGDEHFEMLAARIERNLGTEPRGEFAGEGLPSTLAGSAARAYSASRGWLESAAKRLRSPAWAGAVAVVLVGLGVVLLNVKQAPRPAFRDPMIERRAGQSARPSREADDARGGARDDARGGAPGAGAPLGRESARDDARGEAPEAGAPLGRESARDEAGGAASPSAEQDAVRGPGAPGIAPPKGAASKQEAAQGRAYTVKSTPTGEDARARRPEDAFARPPAAAPGEQREGLKPRRALPLEENRPMTEGEAQSAAGAAEADQAQRRTDASLPPAERSKSRTATLAPAPEAPRPASGATAAQESGTRTSAASPAEPQAPLAASRSGSLVRVCGAVRDFRGRPISSATVTLVSHGGGVSSDAQGRFCIEARPGIQALSVIAVGFSPMQLDADFSPGAPPLVVTLVAVSVIEASDALRGNARSLGGVPQTGAPGDVVRGLADSLQPVASRAVRLTLEAERTKSAPRYDAAAVEWERVRERGAGGALESEARFRIAEARFRAWELAPTGKRVSAANEALTSYLVRAPLGARRDTASAWLGRVKP